ncbi:hypothetical protein GALL_479270 [mine drainage metagenome]|uniref:Uncharacterized protein n=1 Tax=mine drainage metagenome TaxID=410659 RepID=A0A1J5Q3L4_9ZZZZ
MRPSVRVAACLSMCLPCATRCCVHGICACWPAPMPRTFPPLPMPRAVWAIRPAPNWACRCAARGAGRPCGPPRCWCWAAETWPCSRRRRVRTIRDPAPCCSCGAGLWGSLPRRRPMSRTGGSCSGQTRRPAVRGRMAPRVWFHARRPALRTTSRRAGRRAPMPICAHVRTVFSRAGSCGWARTRTCCPTIPSAISATPCTASWSAFIARSRGWTRGTMATCSIASRPRTGGRPARWPSPLPPSGPPCATTTWTGCKAGAPWAGKPAARSRQWPASSSRTTRARPCGWKAASTGSTAAAANASRWTTRPAIPRR